MRLPYTVSRCWSTKFGASCTPANPPPLPSATHPPVAAAQTPEKALHIRLHIPLGRVWEFSFFALKPDPVFNVCM